MFSFEDMRLLLQLKRPPWGPSKKLIKKYDFIAQLYNFTIFFVIQTLVPDPN
jgi:hypothetical protein